MSTHNILTWICDLFNLNIYNIGGHHYVLGDEGWKHEIGNCKHREFLSWLQSLLAKTGSLGKTVLPLL